MKKKKDKNTYYLEIEGYVNSFFKEAYYSKDVEKVKKKIIDKLNDEYIEELSKNKRYAFENVINKYPTLESMVESVGVDKNKIEKWFNKEVTTTYEEFNNMFKKERKHIYITTIISILAGSYLLNSIFYFHQSFVFLFILFFILLIIDIIIIRKHKKDNNKELMSVDSEEKLYKIFDKYSKRCLIWLFILFIEIFGIVFNLINLSLNSKTFEIVEEFSHNLLLIEFVLFFFIKNVLIMKCLNKKVEFENEPIYKKMMNKVLVFSSIYFIVSLGIYYGLEKALVVNPIMIIMILYCVYAFVYYFIKSKKFSYNKKGFNKFILVPLLLVITIYSGYIFLSRDIWLTQPYINSIPYIYEGNDKITYNENNGVYTIKSNEDDFKILQLTDIHLGGSVISYDKDMKALQAVYKLIDYSKPDLVVVTGDLTFPMGVMSFSFNNKAPVSQFAAFMRNTGVPWAFTYGNHDTESMAIIDKEDLNEHYKSLSWKISKNLLYPYVQPKVNGKNIWGRNNQLIEVRNSDGTLNQALFLIDSNAYTGEGLNKYDFIHDDQVEWYKNEILRLNREEGKIISSMGFFHIPLQQYRTAYELYESGSNEIKYFFGSNDEKMINKICASDYPSSLFDTAKSLGSTKGFFCGHDHYNNMSLEYEGIRLTYGMSIDYLVMPGIARDTKQRGATLITSHKDSSIDIEQIPLTSIEHLYK